MDRVRGDTFTFINRFVEKLVYGWVVAALFGHPFDFLTPFIALGFAAGSSPGWADTMGAILEKRPFNNIVNRPTFWMTSYLKKHKWQAAIARALVWAAPVAALAGFDHHLLWIVPIMVVSYVGSLVFTSDYFKGNWEYAETIRGLMTGALISLSMHYDILIQVISKLF